VILEIILFTLIMVAGTAGELCVSRAMKTIGEVHDFRPASVLAVIGRSMKVGWMWLGLALMTTAFLSLLGVLAIEEVSMVVPVTALSYVLGALGGRIFLKEEVSGRRWAGVLLVCTGVALVVAGGK
jgi:drug/metabolite transporter (DMT)-like permease